MKVTRLKILIAALVILGISVFSVPHTGHAATGGTLVTFSTDPTITSTSTGVTSSQAFPDGGTQAACFIQATAQPGAEPASSASGACTGYTLNITCASGVMPAQTGTTVGDALVINGTKSWTGVYDNGSTCTTGTVVGGSKPTLTADVTGLTSGQTVVFYWNTDAGNGFNSPNGRNGCVQYEDSAGTAAEQCIQLSYQKGPGGAFYEATAQAATGTVQQDLGAQLNNNGNMTLGGVFINTTPGAAPAATATTAPTAAATATTAPTAAATATTAPTTTTAATATSTTTTGTPAATETPTAAPTATTTTPTGPTGPTIASAISQFGTDITLTTSGTGVTSSVPFPDGATSSTCFVKVNSKSGAQTENYGNCNGYTVTVTCSSFQFSTNPTSDQHGAAVVTPNGTREQSGAYDQGPSCTTIPNATLTVDVAGMQAGTRLVFYWNNDANPSRNGCVSYTDSTGVGQRACFVNNLAGNNGTFYEVTAGATTGTGFEVQGGTNQVGSSGNVTLGGVFIGTSGGTALAATRISVHSVHGVHHLRWYSAGAVRGFNVYNGKVRLNHHLVTSKTHWYRFNTRHSINKLRIVAVAKHSQS